MNVAKRSRVSRQVDQIVVVVSAMSGVTDGLIKLAKEICLCPANANGYASGHRRATTIALTAMALHALGVEAISLTGAQAGIRTDVSIPKPRSRTSLPKGAFAPGSRQGRDRRRLPGSTPEGQITTLGVAAQT